MSPKRLLIIGSVWPEPSSSAAGQRMMQLIDLFESNNWKITFASTAERGEHCVDLANRGIEQKQIQINDSSFDDFVAGLAPDVVIFDRFLIEEQFGWRVAEACPHAVRVLDTEDLHALRRSRKKALQEERPFHEHDLLIDEVAKREIASIYRSDISLIISEYEVKLLLQLFGIDNSLIQYLPYMLDPISQNDVDELPSFEERTHFVTIGNFRHPPNWDAVQHIRSTIWPGIRKELPKAEFHAYGAYPSQKVWNLHQPDKGFHIKGRAESAGEVVRGARLSLAPLRFGAGLKGKLVESMRWGTPSVTTSIGAEGIAEDQRWGGRIVNATSEIISAGVELYAKKNEWEQAQQRGIQIFNERFANHSLGTVFLERLESIRKNIEEHRRQNFIGGMLQHHTNSSTKYMSKWIEEKNKPSK